MENFLEYGRGLVAFSGGTRLHLSFYAVLALGSITHVVSWDRVAPLRAWFTALPLPLQAAVYAGLLLALCGATIGAPAFIYFQF